MKRMQYEKSATWKECNVKKVQHGKRGTRKECSMKKGATWKEYKIKKMCNTEKVQPEKSATWSFTYKEINTKRHI